VARPILKYLGNPPAAVVGSAKGTKFPDNEAQKSTFSKYRHGADLTLPAAPGSRRRRDRISDQLRELKQACCAPPSRRSSAAAHLAPPPTNSAGAPNTVSEAHLDWP